jgi:hypothetical protein
VAAYQQRLVFDLFPVQEVKDPLLALIRDMEGAEQRAAQAVQDALGELIAGIEKRPSAAVAPAASAPGPSLPTLPAPPPQAPATASERQRVDRLIIVAIDPGHGGGGPRCHRAYRAARKGCRPGRLAGLARQAQRRAGHARDADTRCRLLRALA